MPNRLYCCLLWITVSLCASATPFAATPWPSPALPAALSTFPIADQMTVNGLPMRLKGFVSPRRPTELLDAFRRSLGQPLVESTVAGKQVLGRAEGGFYITVQIEVAGTGSKGIVAVTDLVTMARDHAQGQGANGRWLTRLPAGSVISTHMSSQENGRQVLHMVILNRHAASLNRDALLRLMTDDGYQLEREIGTDAVSLHNLPMQFFDARTLYFKSPGKDAMAVISRSGDQTSIVLNTTLTLQGFQ
ncbi:MAG: hypothetical protein ACI8WM_003167 [Burkholderiaceae bacterium]|jgi:hypothetical protein